VATAIPVTSYGITDTADLILGVPYQRIETKREGISTSERGLSDAFIALKWRFYDAEVLSFAVRPGVTLPTGDDNRGLGSGRTSYSMFFIATDHHEAWAFHLNIGYRRIEYELQADRDAARRYIWHASLASEVKVAAHLKVVADVGVERNPDRASGVNPAFLLGGVIYSTADNVDVDLGVKGGLNKAETDSSILAGVTWRL
jgi:hypothetical protein